MRRMPALIFTLATVLVIAGTEAGATGTEAGATAAPVPAQQAAPTLDIPAGWLQGYARTISASQVIAYPWAYPGQVSTLLVRTVDGTWRVEWEGQAAPAGPADERIVYLWHGGLASGYGAHRFTLTVNGTPCATFTSGRDAADRTWRREGENGCTLAFQTIRVGTFNELFGLMMLTVPRRVVGAAPPRFAVVGEAAGSQDYYLGPETPVEAFVRVRPEQARFKDGRRALRLEVSHLANAAPVVVRTGTTTLHTGTLNPGYNLATLAVDGRAASLPITVEVAGRVASDTTVALPPVRAWEIHLLAHSHVDIGYSDPQPEVERKQWKNLRDAVALAAATASNPPESRFRWNVEGIWSVESYLKQASADERRQFIEAVRQGSIGLQSNYTNILTGLATPEELGRWTDAARRLSAEYGLPVGKSAMHTDIPGLSWTVVSALSRGGIRYFSSGPNYMPSLPDRGDRIGQTLHELGDRPFWWLSPSGQERLLMWVAGRGYSMFHGMNTGSIETGGRQTLLDYMLELAGKDYPYDMVQVRYTIGGDNGPTDPKLPAFVKTWNETFDAPRLVIDTADALFEEFERRYGAKLPEMRGDMTPYWEDGAVSSAAEEAMVRAAARRLQQAETLWAMRNRSGFPSQAFSDAWRQVLLWHEHTWGAADSISQPDRKDVVDQWLYKRAFAVEADRQSRALLAASAPPPGPAFEVVNTLSWSRDAVVFLPAAATKGRDRVIDAAGRTVQSQRLGDGRLAARVIVPALGAIRIRCVPGPATMVGPAIAGNPPVVATKTSLDNALVRVEIDPKTGEHLAPVRPGGSRRPVRARRRRPQCVSLRPRARPVGRRRSGRVDDQGRRRRPDRRHPRDLEHGPRRLAPGPARVAGDAGGRHRHRDDDRQDARAREGERAPGLPAQPARRHRPSRPRRGGGGIREGPAPGFVQGLRRRDQRHRRVERTGGRDHRVARRAALRNRRADRRAQRQRQAARVEEAGRPWQRRLRVPPEQLLAHQLQGGPGRPHDVPLPRPSARSVRSGRAPPRRAPHPSSRCLPCLRHSKRRCLRWRSASMVRQSLRPASSLPPMVAASSSGSTTRRRRPPAPGCSAGRPGCGR